MMKSGMIKIELNDVNEGPVDSEGGRSPSTLSTGHGGAGETLVHSPHRLGTSHPPHTADIRSSALLVKIRGAT